MGLKPNPPLWSFITQRPVSSADPRHLHPFCVAVCEAWRPGGAAFIISAVPTSSLRHNRDLISEKIKCIHPISIFIEKFDPKYPVWKSFIGYFELKKKCFMSKKINNNVWADNKYLFYFYSELLRVNNQEKGVFICSTWCQKYLFYVKPGWNATAIIKWGKIAGKKGL